MHSVSQNEMQASICFDANNEITTVRIQILFKKYRRFLQRASDTVTVTVSPIQKMPF